MVDSARPAGEVVNSYSRGGKRVTLEVSRGTSTLAIVPDVLGQSQSEAEAAISDANLQPTIGRVSTQSPDEDGLVLSQDPEVGEKLTPGTAVTLTVGRYEGPS